MEVYQLRNRLVIGFTLGSSRPASPLMVLVCGNAIRTCDSITPPLYWYHTLVTSALKIVLMDSWSKPQMARKIKSESEVQPNKTLIFNTAAPFPYRFLFFLYFLLPFLLTIPSLQLSDARTTFKIYPQTWSSLAVAVWAKMLPW